jgi:hypothetical protein
MSSQANTDNSLNGYPFRIRALNRGNRFQAFFGMNLKPNAIIELTNLLAKSRDVRTVRPDAIVFLNEKYKLDMHLVFRQEFEDSYREYIRYCLADRQFSKEESDNIFHLKKLFGISDKKHNEIYEEVGKEVYGQCVREALEDLEITDEEREFLKKIGNDLELSDKAIEKAFVAEAGAFYKEKLDEIIERNELSISDDKKLGGLEAKLRNEHGDKFIREVLDELTIARINRCRLFWRIKQGDVPKVYPNINLQKDEKCYYEGNAGWYETRRVMNRIQLAGPSMRLKIANGFYWNFKDYQINAMSEDVLRKVDTGKLYLTNTRLIFCGNMSNKTIKFSSIIDIVPVRGQVQIVKDSGKSPIITLSTDLDIFIALLARMLQDHYEI